MMAIESPSGSEDDRQRVYEHLVGYVDKNTGGRYPPLARKTSAIGSVYRSGRHPDEVLRAMTAACANGDLFRWRSETDRLYLAIDDADALERKIEEFVERKGVRTKEIALRIQVARKRIEHLRGEEDD